MIRPANIIAASTLAWLLSPPEHSKNSVAAAAAATAFTPLSVALANRGIWLAKSAIQWRASYPKSIGTAGVFCAAYGIFQNPQAVQQGLRNAAHCASVTYDAFERTAAPYRPSVQKAAMESPGKMAEIVQGALPDSPRSKIHAAGDAVKQFFLGNSEKVAKLAVFYSSRGTNKPPFHPYNEESTPKSLETPPETTQPTENP